MLDFTTLNRSWATLFDSFAERFEATETEHGRETARFLRQHRSHTPRWQLSTHDVRLAVTLAALPDIKLGEALERLTPFLDWRTRGVFTDSDSTNRAYVEFLGPDGMVRSNEIRLGIYWHDRHTFYPRHRHEAVELYHIVSGTGYWQHVSDDWVARPPGSFVLHQAWEDHATRTEDEPLLALWSWRGNISFESYTMDPAPEALGMGFREFAGR
ncbi:MAG: dimethylsulfonioproprionate lyase family protein [Alphaproteobacteria bacterium]|jgi:hypothetical protein